MFISTLVCHRFPTWGEEILICISLEIVFSNSILQKDDDSKIPPNVLYSLLFFKQESSINYQLFLLYHIQHGDTNQAKYNNMPKHIILSKCQNVCMGSKLKNSTMDKGTYCYVWRLQCDPQDPHSRSFPLTSTATTGNMCTNMHMHKLIKKYNKTS